MTHESAVALLSRCLPITDESALALLSRHVYGSPPIDRRDWCVGPAGESYPDHWLRYQRGAIGRTELFAQMAVHTFNAKQLAVELQDSARFDRFVQLAEAYLGQARPVHLLGDNVVVCHSSFLAAGQPAAPAGIASSHHGITSIHLPDDAPASWVSSYNAAYASLLNAARAGDKTARRTFMLLAGPGEAGVTCSSSPTIKGPDGPTTLQHLRPPGRTLCMLHGHQPNAFGLLIAEGPDLLKISLDTQYSRAVAFGLLLKEPAGRIRWCGDALPVPVIGWGEVVQAFAGWHFAEGPRLLGDVRMVLLRSPTDYLEQRVVFTRCPRAPAPPAMGPRNLIGQVHLRAAADGQALQPIFAQGKAELLPFELQEGGHFQQRCTRSSDGVVTVLFVTPDSDPGSQGVVGRAVQRHPFRAREPVRQSALVGSDVEGNLAAIHLFQDLCVQLGPSTLRIFAGDATDHGADSIAVLEQLLDGFDVLIAGNRDVNKMRMVWETEKVDLP